METATVSEKIVEVDYGEEYKQKEKTVRAIIICGGNRIFGSSTVGEMNFFGRRIFDWCSVSVSDWETTIINGNDETPILQQVKPHLKNEDITVVIFDDTPLIKKSTIRQMVADFANGKRMVERLSRGYILDTNYVKTVEEIYSPEIELTFVDDFIKIGNLLDYHKAMKIMKQRIFAYHTAKGVFISDFATVHIDAEVEIASGVVIKNNNNIFGNTIIEKGAVLNSGNTIKDSFIGENCILNGAFIENAKLLPDTEVAPFEKIIIPKS